MGYAFYLNDCDFKKHNLGTIATPSTPDIDEPGGEGGEDTPIQPPVRQYAVMRSDNPALMDKVKALGWASNDDYMTFDEAAAVTDIGLNFQNETNITSFDEFKYFTGVTSIANSAFSRTSGLAPLTLQKITLPESITSVGSLAFRYCNNLVSLNIPKNVTSFAINAIQDTGIQVLVIDNNTVINNGSIAINTPITTYKIGDNCTAYEVYNDCVYTSGLETLLMTPKTTDITISNQCRTIGQNAFVNSPITSVNLPSSVIELKQGAFSDAKNLTSINLKNLEVIGANAFINAKITSISLDSVKTLGGLAFRYCPLTEVVIGNQCTAIGNAFQNVSTITSLTVKANTPPSIQELSLSGSFTTSGRYIKVPSSAVDTYKNANVWKNYASYIVAM